MMGGWATGVQSRDKGAVSLNHLVGAQEEGFPNC
jgi:hypothetical protein